MNARCQTTAMVHVKISLEASYKCTPCPHSKEFDSIKGQCVISTKQRNLLLGKS